MIETNHRHGCRREDHPRIGRRELLQAGSLSLLGTGMADLLRLEAMAAGQNAPAPRAKSVVFIFQSGGPSQHETFDPKPEAPDKIRGEYGVIPTKNPDLIVCEHLPRLALRADRYSIVRTMYHPADRQFRNEHSASQYMVNTGMCYLPPGENTNSIAMQKARPLEWPSIGSIIAYALHSQPARRSPPVVEIPRAISGGASMFPGTGPGMLGPTYSRWRVNLAPVCRAPDAAGSCPNCFSHDQPDDPERQPGKLPKSWYDNSSCRNPDFSLPDLGTSQGAPIERVADRAGLLESLDRIRRDLDSHASIGKYDAFQRQALDLIVSQRGSKNPFDITQETPAMRDQYGREEWGQAFLVARRLVEAGVRMVQVNLRGWDTHQNAFRDLKGKLLPSIDHCLSGFLDDLHDRGLLDETLIVMCGEMGRTPIISPIAAGGLNAAGVPFTPGRHHWGDVFPCLFAGAGIQPGRVIGKSDARGGGPNTEGFTPSDLAATIFSQLGIHPDLEFHDADGRPFRIYQGAPIAPLL